MKIYKEIEKRNEIEKKGYASYRTLVDNFISNMVLCNNILNLDDMLYDNIVIGKIEDDYGNIKDIYQAYIIDLAFWNIEYIQEELKDTDDLIIAYSDMLDCYVLLVDHLGTSWDYVSTDIELTDNFDEI